MIQHYQSKWPVSCEYPMARGATTAHENTLRYYTPSSCSGEVGKDLVQSKPVREYDLAPVR